MIHNRVLSLNFRFLRYPYFNSFFVIYEIKLQATIYVLRMPKYAVARGYTVGIYDTWKECEEQVKGYHKAKYKKFDSLTEAEDFIKNNKDISNVENSIVRNNLVENEHAAKSYTVPRISPANVTLNMLSVSFHHLEERLNTFMRDTHSTLSDIQKRLVVLESQQSASTPFQLLKTESRFEETESKGNKRQTEPDSPTLRKTMKISSEPWSLRNLHTTTSESNTELYTYIKGEDGFIKVYTDGACSKNGKLGAKAGIGVWFSKHHPLNVSEPVRGYATNNNAEIQAATKAILQATKAGITKLNVHTDSQFMIKCITSWIHKWKRNSWKLSDGGPVKNKEELISLDEAIQNMECVRWTYVKGHSGDVGNSEADALARKGAEMYQCNITYGLK